MHRFQLWANLPSSSKITDARYPHISLCAIPEVADDKDPRGRHLRRSRRARILPV